jgi:hypothetical protein
VDYDEDDHTSPSCFRCVYLDAVDVGRGLRVDGGVKNHVVALELQKLVNTRMEWELRVRVCFCTAAYSSDSLSAFLKREDYRARGICRFVRLQSTHFHH